MKRNYIELVTEVDEKGEVKDKKTFVTPGFIPFAKLMKASQALENTEGKTDMEAIDEMFKVVADLYNNQFTVEEIKNGLHAPDTVKELEGQIEFISSGKLDEERQKELNKLLK
ncbi:hypothetical protein PYH69_09530 [Mammaliicoccus lentus]|uniref:Phage protein n=1 Tax=Mammaliicoccus lentus TaxID=42858 RepID=A0AAX3W1Q4_MAMLE|nr:MULTISPECIES: hypothetical protein [Mammaliicoccus]WHI58996.1 hypothetical protein PYH69_09530 [Mammaliicoccus lentus]